MLKLKRLAVEGFGPFAERQLIEFPDSEGVTVIYGENMRGKTSLLNAIRYAFFGTVLGRTSSSPRRLHTISNRDLAANGKFGFCVSLAFDSDGDDYELVRECRPSVLSPNSDEDYRQDFMLRRGGTLLGPDEKMRVLQTILPGEVSRFFLFDGELLQEYETLLSNESLTGKHISEAIERILGVPILKKGKWHLEQLLEAADKQAGKEASRHQATQAIGNALQQATEQKEAHRAELARLQGQLQELNAQKADVEQLLQSQQKYASILENLEAANTRLDEVADEISDTRTELQRAMGDAWRSILRDSVRAARDAAQRETQVQLDAFVLSLRRDAVTDGHCKTCDQDVPPAVRARLQATIASVASAAGGGSLSVSAAMTRLADLNKFQEMDNTGEVRQLSRRLHALEMERVALMDRIGDLKTDLEESDPEMIRSSKLAYGEIIERISIVNRAIKSEEDAIAQKDQAIQKFKKTLETTGTPDLRATQARAKVLRNARDVFAAAIDRYKSDLRLRVESTATDLFRLMTTEKHDYERLTINESYGLTIRHRDGRAEDARSAGAEHVVALALMGALQRNAPLRGPIVMDSPFGRLDEEHTSNVVKTLPDMAPQVVLLVYEGEVGKTRMRNLLGGRLLREYELERISSRRTSIKAVR